MSEGELLKILATDKKENDKINNIGNVYNDLCIQRQLWHQLRLKCPYTANI